MRTRFVILAVFGLCTILACAKKASPEECQQAVGNLSKLLGKYVVKQMKKNINLESPAAADAQKDMDAQLKRIDESTGLEGADPRNFEVCAKQKRTLVICVSTAKTLEETIQACGMKQSGSSADLTVSWPD
ncbi:MAG: hypothetical protein V1495_11475 [Pseudomonadota bacterium]